MPSQSGRNTPEAPGRRVSDVCAHTPLALHLSHSRRLQSANRPVSASPMGQAACTLPGSLSDALPDSVQNTHREKPLPAATARVRDVTRGGAA